MFKSVKERKEIDWKRKRRKIIEKQLPDLILELSITLNSGLVFDAAYKEVMDSQVQDDLKDMLKENMQEAEKSNISIVYSLYSFALDSGCRDFIRTAGLIYDHFSTGAMLSDKLDRERETLWNKTLASARGKAKEADTKLSLPLTLMLLVLVIICTAPAFIIM